MKKVIAGFGTFSGCLLFIIILIMSSVSFPNVMQDKESITDTEIYAYIKETYVDYIEEVMLPKLKKLAKQNYQKEVEECKKKTQQKQEEENKKAAEEGREAHTVDPVKPTGKVVLTSTVPNVCYVLSYIMTKHDEAKTDFHTFVFSKKEVYEFLNAAVKFEHKVTTKNGNKIYNATVVIKPLDQVQYVLKLSEDEKQLCTMSYELLREEININEVVYKKTYKINTDGSLTLDKEENDAAENFFFDGNENFLTVPYYCQYDKEWALKPYGNGTIKSSGCGPTCCAMIVSYFMKQRITPADIVSKIGNKYYVSGAGSSWALYPGISREYGFNCRDLGKSMNKVVTELQAGHPVIASVGPGTFTKGGHFIVLTGVNKSGNITVNDPSHPEFCSKSFSPALITRESKNFWSFSK